MAINYFVGWSQQELVEELVAAQEDLAAGKATVRAESGGEGGGVRIQSQMDISAVSRIELLLQALNRIDPVTYPADQISRTGSFRCVISGGPRGESRN